MRPFLHRFVDAFLAAATGSTTAIMTQPNGEQELDLEQMWIDAQVEF